MEDDVWFDDGTILCDSLDNCGPIMHPGQHDVPRSVVVSVDIHGALGVHGALDWLWDALTATDLTVRSERTWTYRAEPPCRNNNGKHRQVRSYLRFANQLPMYPALYCKSSRRKHWLL